MHGQQNIKKKMFTYIYQIKRHHAANSLVKYKVYLAGIQRASLDKGSTARSGDCILLYGKEKENHNLGTGLLAIT